MLVGFTDDEFIFFCKSADKQHLLELVLVDEVVDVHTGLLSESAKAKNDPQLQALLHSGLALDRANLAERVVTLMHGDFIHPQPFVFLTRTPEEAAQWKEELTRRARAHFQKPQELFYYWRRLFAKLRVSMKPDQYLTTDLVLDTVMPWSSKQREERRALEKQLQRLLPVLKDKKRCSASLLKDAEFLLKLYKALTGRAEVDQTFAAKFSQPNTSAAQFRAYLNEEHRDKRLNEILYPPVSEEAAARIMRKNRVGSGERLGNFFFSVSSYLKQERTTKNCYHFLLQKLLPFLLQKN